MNHLDFSPISQKDQQSIDTYSFLHNQLHSNNTKATIAITQACNKISQKLSRVIHNRQCYSFQLLKQFILFSSDEQTIQIDYKYMQYQLQQGTQHLENTYGIKRKLTLGKALEDIRNYSRKKIIYQNPVSIQQLVSVYDKILHLNKRQSYRCVIKILAQFIQKQVINNKCHIKNNRQQPTAQLIHNLQKQIEKQKNIMYYQQQQPNYTTNLRKIQKINIKNINQKNQTNDKRIRRNDLLKTAKFSKKIQDKQHSSNSSNRKQQVLNVDSYEEQLAQQNHRQFFKSKSSHLYQAQNLQQKYDSNKNYVSRANRQNKCVSITGLPSRKIGEEEVFQTRRKNTTVSGLVNQGQFTQNTIQNVIVIRGSKSHRRQPDRYIRVPVVSNQIKIVEFIPEIEKKKQRKVQNFQKSLNFENITLKHQSNQNYHKSARSSKSGRFQYQQKLSERSNKMYRDNIQYSDQLQTHVDCLGCKYCHVIKEMETYRLQRNNKIKSFVLM